MMLSASSFNSLYPPQLGMVKIHPMGTQGFHPLNDLPQISHFLTPKETKTGQEIKAPPTIG